ncbi:MAG: DNA-binding protein [Defluviitaleaceae bacterium]|nr:DNA-binding protein [Defluviitaleaceae bacterium]
MNLPETRQQKNLLFDFYEVLLTAKQREVFTMHYMEDHSLAEIGDFMGITPQAVADMLKRVNGRLNHYDKLLGMTEKFKNQQALATKINLALDDLEQNPMETGAIIAQIRRLLNNLTSNL